MIKQISRRIKSYINILNNNLNYLLKSQIQDNLTILDLGCGPKSRLSMVKNNEMVTVGVDIFKNYIETAKKGNTHDKYYNINILEIDKVFQPKSFDCIILLEVIEHLTKIEAIRLLKKMERIAKNKIIISTPNGKITQARYDNNIFQRHKSSWDVKIFKKMNYDIIGFNGFKYIRGELSIIKKRPVKLWQAISTLSNIVVKRWPQFAFQLFCIKRLDI